jgi:hypothetical protein
LLFSSFPSQEALQEFMNQVTKYSPGTGGCVRGRRFCVTEAGYVGLVPPGSEKGDRVCIIYGAQTPFIVRLDDEIIAVILVIESIPLIGDCHFYGMMDAETLFNRL